MSIEYVFNPFTASLDAIDVEVAPEVMMVPVTTTMVAQRLYVTPHIMMPKTERIVLNGMELSPGVGYDYTIMNDHIHFEPNVLRAGDQLKIIYQIKLG